MSDDKEEVIEWEKKTSTEILVDVMEQFGVIEPDKVLVIWTTKNFIAIRTNGDHIYRAGMAAYAQASAISRMLSSPIKGDDDD